MNEATDRCVQNFAVVRCCGGLKHIRMITSMHGLMHFRFTTQEFSMVGSYMEDLKKRQNCQNWEVGACTGMGACPGQYCLPYSAKISWVFNFTNFVNFNRS